MLKIVLRKGHIGIPDRQRRVLQALGLRKIGSSVRMADDKVTRGMVQRVAHLVSVEKAEE